MKSHNDEYRSNDIIADDALEVSIEESHYDDKSHYYDRSVVLNEAYCNYEISLYSKVST